MPQMSPLLWSITIMMTISLLLTISSFLYFIVIPAPHQIYLPMPLLKKPFNFIWLW